LVALNRSVKLSP